MSPPRATPKPGAPIKRPKTKPEGALLVPAATLPPYYAADSVSLYQGSCLDVLARFPEACVDSVVTDPPYELGMMGKAWDSSGVAFQKMTWATVLRVVKPGGFLCAFGGTRTWHRLVCAVEDAGWEVRDCVMWMHGTGFPKSLDISKAIDKAAGAKREVIGKRQFADGTFARDGAVMGQHGAFRSAAGYPVMTATDAAKKWNGWGTALKPSWEPVLLAMKPCEGTFADNARKHGVAGLNIEGARLRTDENLNGGAYSSGGRKALPGDTRKGRAAGMFAEGGGRLPGRFKPPLGRWPANTVLDEDAARMLDAQSGITKSTGGAASRGGMGKRVFGKYSHSHGGQNAGGLGDAGGASRFFYVAKASRKERGPGNEHPTVKPLALMEWLCRLTATPTGGIVLDPFAGSGTTLLAARAVGRPAVGIELVEDYCAIARRRLEVKP